jgi:hypothetical protein
MLRTITTQQLYELFDYSRIEPFGEERMDLRFALLASALVGAAGGKAIGGQPYTASVFLRALRFDELEEEKHGSKPTGQSVEYMEMLLRSWTDASNQSLREERRGNVT